MHQQLNITGLWTLLLFLLQLTHCVLIHPAATWVGGGFVFGTVEMVYTPSMGLIEAVIMITAYGSSFFIGKKRDVT